MPIFTIKEKGKFILKLEVYNGFFIPISIYKKMHNKKEWATNFLGSKTLKQKKGDEKNFFLIPNPQLPEDFPAGKVSPGKRMGRVKDFLWTG